MAIRTGGEVTRLVADLCGTDAVRREAATARLRVIGARAVDPIAAVVRSAVPADQRVAALHVLEGLDDPRAADVALAALGADSGRVQTAAIGVLRGWIAREDGTRILEALTTLALDRTHDTSVRVAALDAIAELPAHIVTPILEQAAVDPKRPAAEDPAWVHVWLETHDGAPLSELHALVTHLREEERKEPSATKREAWCRARGAVHAALARRGSKVALYDLRETFDAATTPLALDYLSAIGTIGDATCLEPMARAWAAAPTERWWRERLTDAAKDILQRERLTGRSGVVKRIRARFEGFV